MTGRDDVSSPAPPTLPPGWSWATVGDISSLIQYGSSAKAGEAGDVPVLRMGNIDDGRLRLHDLKYLPAAHPEFPELLLAPGDLLFNRTNSPELVGKTAVYEGTPAPCSFASYLLRIRLPKYEPQLLAHYINSPTGRAWIAASISQQVGQANVNGSKLRALSVPVPPLPEQRRIVAKIDALTAKSRRAKDALDAIPALLERFRQSVLAAAFRGDLTADWREKNLDVEPAEELLERIRAERRRRWEEAELAKMRAKGKVPGDDRWKERYEEPEPVDASKLPELPEGWAWASVDEVTQSHDHRRIPVKLQDRTERAGRFPYYGAFGIIDYVDNYIFDGRFILIAEDGKNLMDRRRPISLVAEGQFWVNNHAHVLEPLGNVPHEYMSCYFNSVDLADRLTGIDQVKLTAGALTTVPVPVAPAAEMALVAARVSASLRKVEAVTRISAELLTNIATLDKAILAKAFRGELVPQDPNDEPASVLVERIRAEAAQNGQTTNGAGRRRAAPSLPQPTPTDPPRKPHASRRGQTSARSRG